jgi:LysM repeat protein
MIPLRLLIPASASLLFASCASQKADDYDTANPYGTADYGTADASVAPVNPTYDTPAAYEETSTTTTTQVPAPPVAPHLPASKPVPSPATSGGVATVHTIGKGDTLWGLSKKYKVSVDAIKQANGLTKDTVVLGSKLNIPAR